MKLTCTSPKNSIVSVWFSWERVTISLQSISFSIFKMYTPVILGEPKSKRDSVPPYNNCYLINKPMWLYYIHINYDINIPRILTVMLPTAGELRRVLLKHSITEPLGMSDAVVWTVELRVWPVLALIMITVNGAQDAFVAILPWLMTHRSTLGSTQRVTAMLGSRFIWMQVKEMESPGHTVSNPFIAIGIEVSLPKVSTNYMYTMNKYTVQPQLSWPLCFRGLSDR